MSTNCNNLIKTPLVTVANIAAMASSAHHNRTTAAAAAPQPQKHPQHPITTTKMGSRRIFSAQFKLTVLDSYRMDADCKGNQRATARKYGIHRRQIQKWLQNETNLRSSVNNNNNSDLQNNQNNNNGNGSGSNSSSSHNSANKMSAMQTLNGGAVSNGRTVNNLSLSAVDNVSAKQQRLMHENASATNKSILNQSTMSGSPTTNFHFTKNHHHHHQQQQKHNEINAMSLDMPRHSVAAAVAAAAAAAAAAVAATNTRNQNSGNNSIEQAVTKTKAANYIDCYGISSNSSNNNNNHNNNKNVDYKCATNAAAATASTTNTSFSVSSTSTSPTLAPSFVTRPIPHSSNESAVSYASQRQPLRIVSPSYLLPSPQANATHACANGIPMIEPSKAGAFHSLAHYSAATYSHPQSAAAFHDINPMLYDSVQPTLGMIPSIRHYLSAPHELQVASFAAATRVMPSAFENAFHLAPPQNGYYEHPSAYDLYHPSYMTAPPPPPLPPTSSSSSMAMPATIMAERIIPKTEIITTETETKPYIDEMRLHERPETLQSPIDLTVPGRQTPTDTNPSIKPPRFSLPSPPVKAAYKVPDIPYTDNNNEIDSKPWDLRCTHKRKIDIADDIDEGIGVSGEQSKTGNKTSASSPTPAKAVKLFKPYLLSSDDEDDERSGKKCSKSDQSHRDPIIWSTHTFFDTTNSPTTITPFQSPLVNTQPQTHSSSSYWSNHGSPVSGYDSASSTFSDCNCSDSNCQPKLASPAPTVASTFSDDFTASPSSNSNSNNNINSGNSSDRVATHAEPTVVSTQPTKYIVPRRHILEKWSHEDDELQSSQFNQSQQELIIMR